LEESENCPVTLDERLEQRTHELDAEETLESHSGYFLIRVNRDEATGDKDTDILQESILRIKSLREYKLSLEQIS